MPEPADLRRIYNIDMDALRSGFEAVADRSTDELAGVQLVDPQAEKIADIVSAAVVAAVAAQSAKGATTNSVRNAVRAAVNETA